jgi:hypothetical protein
MMPTDPIPMLTFFGLTILRIGVPLLVIMLLGTAVQRYQAEMV